MLRRCVARREANDVLRTSSEIAGRPRSAAHLRRLAEDNKKLGEVNPQVGLPADRNIHRRYSQEETRQLHKSIRGWRELSASGGITRTFEFAADEHVYAWMGRLMAFAHETTTFPKVQVDGRRVNVLVVNKAFDGLTQKEWLIAAFCNDQWFQMDRANQAAAELRKAATAHASCPAADGAIAAAADPREA